jgi:hypothetical protein
MTGLRIGVEAQDVSTSAKGRMLVFSRDGEKADHDSRKVAIRPRHQQSRGIDLHLILRLNCELSCEMATMEVL